MKNLISSYMNFLNESKTERRCVANIIKEARKYGFKDIKSVKKLKAGDKVYFNKMNKSVILFRLGSENLENGMNILGAHLDSPRLDIKQNPLYESDGLVYMNTHYYGGIKKYQWLTLPLAVYGVVCLKNGKTVEIAVGDNEDDPVFCVSDILPHLAYKQQDKKVSDLVDAEKLDLMVGCCKNKKAILDILEEKYGIKEEDFESSELEVVPAGKARYAGFDKKLIISYGQDDKVCAYTSLMAFLEEENVKRTSCCILCDKEEIGSYGATGMNSHLLDNAVAEVVALTGTFSELTVRRALANSIMLSSDVNSAYDPLNAELYDKDNSSYLGKGVVFTKYTGARGKSGASDANPEFIAKIRKTMDSKKIKYQTGELGKVEIGGGGTIAHYAAEYGMQVIDCGVSVMSMHAPWEVTSTFDVETVYKAYKAFLGMEN